MLSSVFNALLHSSVHTTDPLPASSLSIGPTNSLKWGTKGDAQRSFPRSCCSYLRFVGMVTYAHPCRNLSANLYPAPLIWNPSNFPETTRNLHLRRFNMNPALHRVLMTLRVCSHSYSHCAHLPHTEMSSKKAFAVFTPDRSMSMSTTY